MPSLHFKQKPLFHKKNHKKKALFRFLCTLGLVGASQQSLAEILAGFPIEAGKTAPKHQQPTVLQTANGIP